MLTIENLIKELDYAYPDKIATREQSPYEQGLDQGARKVIDFIKVALEYQDEKGIING